MRRQAGAAGRRGRMPDSIHDWPNGAQTLRFIDFLDCMGDFPYSIRIARQADRPPAGLGCRLVGSGRCPASGFQHG